MESSAAQLVEQLQGPLGARLLGEIASVSPAEREAPRFVMALRRSASAELVSLALRVAAAGEKAPAKFPDADRLLFTPELLEMASAHPPALHRARRAAPHGSVLDLGCGAGGDLSRMALVATQPPSGLERDPLAAALARANLDRLGLAGEVFTGTFPDAPLPAHDILFVDPGRRRADGRRLGDPRGFSPSPSQLAPLLARSSAWGMKWGPALDLDPSALCGPGGPLAGMGPEDFELELVSWRGEVREAVLWGGDARRGNSRQASVLAGPHKAFETHIFQGDRGLDPPPLSPEREWIIEPDGAIIRAGLLAAYAAQQGCGLLAEGIAYLTAADPCERPLARSWPLIEAISFSLSALQEALDRRGAGSITLKKRGFPLDPEELRPKLRLSGDRPVTVLIYRSGDGHRACICGPERLGPPEAPTPSF